MLAAPSACLWVIGINISVCPSSRFDVYTCQVALESVKRFIRENLTARITLKSIEINKIGLSTSNMKITDFY